MDGIREDLQGYRRSDRRRMNFFPSTDAAVDFVTEFLRFVEDRRLDEASRFLSDEVEIVFPGGRRFSSLDEQIGSSRGRFTEIRKSFERFDVLDMPGRVVVYAMGQLSGTDVRGHEFSQIRFIDRFTIIDGLITEQAVWNDFAETR